MAIRYGYKNSLIKRIIARLHGKKLPAWVDIKPLTLPEITKVKSMDCSDATARLALSQPVAWLKEVPDA